MNYTLHQLHIFIKVCELGSVTKAADELFLTQPAISIQLKKLQEQFDSPLTEVVGRKIYVTDFGKDIAEVCKNILREAERIQLISQQYKGLLTGKISISVVSTGKYIIPFFIRDFVQKHNAIDINIDVTNKSRVLESLMRNETDFALVSILPNELDILKIPLMENKLYLVGNNQHKYEKKVPQEKIAEMSLIFREQGSATRLTMENFLKSHNISTGKRIELVSNEAVKQAVIAGLGNSIMPLIGMKNEIQSGILQIINVDGLPVTTEWNLIYNRSKQLTPASKALIDFINNNKDNIINSFFGEFPKNSIT